MTLLDYTLGLADDALVSAQRMGWWISRAPQLEEDLALANIGLDQLGQARAGILRVEEILGALGVPLNLRDLGLEPSMFEFVATQSMLATRLLANNPRDLTHDAVLEILRRGYHDDRGWMEF